jgi:hypothetical protein
MTGGLMRLRVCKLCGEQFTTLHILIEHFEKKHADLPEVKWYMDWTREGVKFTIWEKYRRIKPYITVYTYR